MKNKYRIKHFRSRIYNPLRGKITKVVLTVVVAAALFALGWFTYEPLMKQLNEVNKGIIEDNPVEPYKEPEKVVEEVPQFIEKASVAVTVPEEVLYSTSEFGKFLNSLDDSVTAVILDIKTKEGRVTYLSEQEGIKNRKSVSENAVDISKRIDAARLRGFDVVARIYAFEDNIAPYEAYNMAIRYESDDGVLWLDDSIDNGGKPWLNPYSDSAQKYVLDIVYDAMDNKFDAIILDGLRFPGDAGINYAYFGPFVESVGRNEILKQFVEHVYTTTMMSDTDLLVAYDAYTVISGGDNIYGGSPAVFGGDGLSPRIDLNAFVGRKISDSINYNSLPEDVSELTLAVYEALGYATENKLFPMLVCEGLTAQQLEQLKAGLSSCGASGFFIEYDEVFFNGEPEQPEEELPEPEPVYTPESKPNPVPEPTPEPEPEPEQMPEEEENSGEDEPVVKYYEMDKDFQKYLESQKNK